MPQLRAGCTPVPSVKRGAQGTRSRFSVHGTLIMLMRRHRGEVLFACRRSAKDLALHRHSHVSPIMPFKDAPKTVIRDVYDDLNRATLEEARNNGWF
ncbi:hypothetical protein NITLEN_80167 [Nitrospira lenta]|uniref:Uncharacterized protein n=1 Tax=Nitrospira lenta TaxID=1436998 RepID=A0A330L9N0_9BACT|nr:hypothetical protein NITLEN_80167 [Nitrospira lenta]